VTAGPSASADFWEPRYQGADPAWGRQPNARLVTVLPGLGLQPGQAWDVGCGHGGDALWLASLGWHVTATDVSGTAVSRVAAAAAGLGLGDRVTAAQHDLSRSRPEGTFHLVYACYFHSPVPLDRDHILRDAARRVRPGGCLVVIDHGSAAPWSWRPSDGREPEFPAPEQILAGLGLGPGWETETCERAERAATGPDDQTATVTDNIIVTRRA
jgi:SAM-dependent methyltransferase